MEKHPRETWYYMRKRDNFRHLWFENSQLDSCSCFRTPHRKRRFIAKKNHIHLCHIFKQDSTPTKILPCEEFHPRSKNNYSHASHLSLFHKSRSATVSHFFNIYNRIPLTCTFGRQKRILITFPFVQWSSALSRPGGLSVALVAWDVGAWPSFCFEKWW